MVSNAGSQYSVIICYFPDLPAGVMQKQEISEKSFKLHWM